MARLSSIDKLPAEIRAEIGRLRQDGHTIDQILAHLADMRSRLIDAYDRPGTLFYLDPPYWNCETDYGDGVFTKADFEAMATQLRHIKGRFLLSLNDTPEVRAIFAGFQIESVQTTYSVNSRAQKPAGEVLISPA